MINRNLTQSQYVFNSDTGMLEKLETVETIPETANTLKNDIEPVTSIMVITAQDNLIHNYFYSYETSWDATNCLQIAIIKMPKMNQENVNYWATYTGQLTIYMGYNFTLDKVNQSTHATEQEIANFITRYWDNSGVKPYFRGEVDKIKEYKNDIIIYVKNIGARFQQKIPEDFRQSFIFNQPVRDSFQAICEFLGVPFICPPQTVQDAEGEEQEVDETENDGTENDVGQQLSNAQSLANRAKQKVKKKQNSTSSNSNNSSTSNNSNNSNSDTDSENSEDENAEDTESLEDDVTEIINGFDDISFDANGAIVHGSTVIETSPDMAETLVALEEHPFEKYLEDETGIVEKINKFLKGDMFEELHNNVMDYGAITIEPKSASSSEMSNTDSSTGDNGSESSEDGSSNSGGGGSSSFGNTSSRAREKNGWIGGQLYSNGKIVLSKNYINTLSPEQARQKRTGAYANHTYTDDTMQKLLWRSLGIYLK